MRRLLLLVCAAGSIAGAHDIISTKITWSKEISRLIFQRCASCHREGGSAFSLIQYDEARPWAKAIKDEVLNRRMPPWNAVKGFGEFRDEAGLTQEQISLIANWVEGGAPEGDPAYLPPKPGVPSSPGRAVYGGIVNVRNMLLLKAPGQFAAIQPGKMTPGESVQVTATLPDGSVEPLLWVQNFNPSYDRPYQFAKPVNLPAGTRIQVSPPGRVSVALLRSKR